MVKRAKRRGAPPKARATEKDQVQEPVQVPVDSGPAGTSGETGSAVDPSGGVAKAPVGTPEKDARPAATLPPGSNRRPEPGRTPAIARTPASASTRQGAPKRRPARKQTRKTSLPRFPGADGPASAPQTPVAAEPQGQAEDNKPRTNNKTGVPAQSPHVTGDRRDASLPATEIAAGEATSEKEAVGRPAGTQDGKANETVPAAVAREQARPEKPAEVVTTPVTLETTAPAGASPQPPTKPAKARAPSEPRVVETVAPPAVLAPQPHVEVPGPAPAVEPVLEPVVTPEQTPLPEVQPAPPAREELPAVVRDQRPALFVVHIAPEMAPVAKVGGLADVVFGLTRELAIRGNHVETILPKYDSLRYDHIFGMQVAYEDLWVPWYGGGIRCTVYFGFVHERKCFFIEPHSQENFFARGSIYGFQDDLFRFAFFSRAAMEFLYKSGKSPDIIHCHDWQTALVPVLLYEIYQHLGMTHPRVCLTIHNFKHQGLTGAAALHALGLHPPERFFDYSRLLDNRNKHVLNLLKGGIVYANFVTTVSPRYALETSARGEGFGLEPTLHTHHGKYGGVVNGIDYELWNPETDAHIPAPYRVDSIELKYENKHALRERLMLAESDKPIVAFIGRLDPQKGLELVRHAIFYSLERGAQFVLLGDSPDDAINADFWSLKRMLNDSPDCHLEIGFDEDLAHLIYAGADLMLVPSRFEPCGLTQLIALRYGTIPVVRAVGGLADTVSDKDHSDRPLHERNGYVFKDYNQPGLESALGRAIACYYGYPDDFRQLILNAMRSDHSWTHPGQDYLNIYHHIRA